MKRLLLLFLLCLLLANTELRAQENDTKRWLELLLLLRSLKCYQECERKFQEATSAEAMASCIRYAPWEYCKKIRDIAIEEYQVCVSRCW
jgi:hypothetical protein